MLQLYVNHTQVYEQANRLVEGINEHTWWLHTYQYSTPKDSVDMSPMHDRMQAVHLSTATTKACCVLTGAFPAHGSGVSTHQAKAHCFTLGATVAHRDVEAG